MHLSALSTKIVYKRGSVEIITDLLHRVSGPNS